MDRLTERGAEGIKTFCSGCTDRPMFGKCDIGAECYQRQVFMRAQAYEDTGLTPEDISRLTGKVEASENTAPELKAQLEIYKGFPGSRLNELIDADMAGRLVVERGTCDTCRHKTESEAWLFYRYPCSECRHRCPDNYSEVVP